METAEVRDALNDELSRTPRTWRHRIHRTRDRLSRPVSWRHTVVVATGQRVGLGLVQLTVLPLEGVPLLIDETLLLLNFGREIPEVGVLGLGHISRGMIVLQ